jgi:hypothetical protein
MSAPVPDFGKLFKALGKQTWKANQLLLGTDTVPTWVQGDKQGSVKMQFVPRSGNGPTRAADKSNCLFLLVVAELDGKGFQFDIDRHLAYAKKEQHAATSVSQSVSFRLTPTNADLAKTGKVGYDDLLACYTTELATAWHSADYKPSGNRQSSELSAYIEEVVDKLMFPTESPYGPVSEGADGNLFKASYKFAPAAGMRSDPKKTKPVDAAIAAAFPGEHIQTFIEENPDQCVQFVKLHDEKGKEIEAADYFESATTMFGPGAIVVAELMVPFGGETIYAGSKRTVIPKLVSLQAVVRGTTSRGGGGAGPCDWQEAMNGLDAAADVVPVAEELDSEDDAAGTKRKSKFGKGGARKK